MHVGGHMSMHACIGGSVFMRALKCMCACVNACVHMRVHVHAWSHVNEGHSLVLILEPPIIQHHYLSLSGTSKPSLVSLTEE